MEAMMLTLMITSILLIIGVLGTVIGIIQLVYPSSGRHNLQIRTDRKIRPRREH